jgi:hypothetical protein
MGKALILIVAASILGGGVVLFGGIQRTVYQADRELSEHEARILARYIAQSGLSEARAVVLREPDAFSTTTEVRGRFNGGTYVTTITPGQTGGRPSVTLRVDGAFDLGASRGAATHTIETTYRLAEGAGGGPSESLPEFWQYGLLMEGALTVNGNVSVLGAPNVNANVHTNDRIQLNGNNTFEGFGTHVTGAHSNPGWRLHSSFTPRANPDDLPTVQQVSRVDIPIFDAVEHRYLATRQDQGNLHLSGNVQLGTREDPTIWYVGGDLTINGGTRLAGYGVFLVRGNINLAGNFQTTNAVGNESNVGFYTSGNVNMNGTVEVHGQFWARQNLNFSGNSRLYGSIVVGGVVNWNGNPTIHYRGPSPALVDPIWPDEDPASGEWEPVSYREWAGREAAVPAGE